MARLEAGDVCKSVGRMTRRAAERDKRQMDLLAIRRGDYESVAPGLFPEDFDKAMVANLVDTAAHDLSEVMAPLPAIQCISLSQSSESAKRFAAKRGQIAKGYVQRSRLQDQMYAAADRYASFGFMAYVVEPSFEDRSPIIRVEDTATVYYILDGRGRTRQYAALYTMSAEEICALYPEAEQPLKAKGYIIEDRDVTVISWLDDDCRMLVLGDCGLELAYLENPIGRCPVRVVERPNITKSTHGQFDDVIWVQIARALVQVYTMSALEQSVNAPIVLPDDVQTLQMGPMSTLRTANPQGVGRVPLAIPQGVFPEASMLMQEQLAGSRYPEGRSGSINASVITGQGVQALMGTFDTQIQTFQRLNQSALEDIVGMSFEMDQRLWPNTEKTVRIRDNGSPAEVKYIPSKDISHDFSADVSYGAIAGLDPNRGLVFTLQALAARLISKATARRQMPVDINVAEEERAIDLEEIRESLAASIAALPQAIPMLASQGQDPRQIVMDVNDILKRRAKGASIEDAVDAVFNPPPDPNAPPPADPLAALMGGAGGAGPPGAPGAPPPGGGGMAGGPATPGQSLLMSLAGMSPGGGANLRANVSRRQPA